MLSLVNAFGGLSSAELMTLFGGKSSSSISTSKTPDQSASPGVSGANTNNPANAIQTILAQAQIDKADIEQALTPPSSPSPIAASTAQSAPTGASAANDTTEATSAQTATSGAGSAHSAAAQTASRGSTSETTDQSESASISGSTANNPANTIRAIVAQTQIDTSQATAPGSFVSTTVEYASDSYAEDFQPQTTMSFTSETNAQGEQVDSFEFGLTFGGRAVTVAFSIEGLNLSVNSPVQVAVGAMALGNPIGNLGDSFHIGIPAGSEAANAEFNIYGLDATQAQQLSAAFEEATLAPDDPEKTPSGADLYYENSGIGFSAQFNVATGFKDLDQANIPGT